MSRSDADDADTLAVTVLDVHRGKRRCVEPEQAQQVRQRGLDRAKGAVGHLQGDAEAVGRGGAEQPLGPTLGDPPVERLDEDRIGGDRAAEQLGVGCASPAPRARLLRATRAG